jgi:uncharacterized protein
MDSSQPFDPNHLERPHSSLLTYYALMSLLTGPGALVMFWPLFFKYETLRYKFEDDGMSMSWGILFRHEINLTYRRIQDIHLTRNIIQRWLGLATLSIQTASGSARPEMGIEGILKPEKLRDYLYSKMRGAREHTDVHPQDEALVLLREIRDLLSKR